ncbi:hypothetical protein CYLTODRAFT_488563 [Cylindrobasidium torrendii FP15055 ss-10]|uniref:DUF6593 domain-containing protein n=1 Tax=Cylindrobasidium torrendii FP15055 ss-10 TaxID=1314674 RepID=A0A0D7BIE1_9AGAR|nr:hypothetical protein CYLTODRAFT_488563 [Cylindrobasidium torrendii FP15055 ss-10]
MHLYLTNNDESVGKHGFTDDLGRTLYTADTPWRKTVLTTTLKRGDGHVVAEITMPRYKKPEQSVVVSVGGKEANADEMFLITKDNFIGQYVARLFVAPDGGKYIWSTSFGKTQLAPKGGAPALATFKTAGMFSGKAMLDIAPQGEDILDEIMVGFLLVELLKNQKKEKNVDGAFIAMMGAPG